VPERPVRAPCLEASRRERAGDATFRRRSTRVAYSSRTQPSVGRCRTLAVSSNHRKRPTPRLTPRWIAAPAQVRTRARRLPSGILTSMKRGMQSARTTLEGLLESNELTTGMYVRVHGDNLIVGRELPCGPDDKLEPIDRVRLTRLGPTSWGLSVRRHTGRWERTPSSGA
jgi:hypothetical protein